MIGITLGEHRGIGFEILAKSSPQWTEKSIKVYGDKQKFKEVCALLDIPFPYLWQWHDVACKHDTKQARAQYVLEQLNQATKEALNETITGVVTCPIDKNIVRSIQPDFDGHTSYLKKQSRAEYSIMLMKNSDFSIVVGTQHIALRDVPKVFSQDYFVTLIQQVVSSYGAYFKKQTPKIAVLGLNPHAGEIDMNAEEKQWMKPSIENMKKDGIAIEGPFPADSFFASNRDKDWDLIISPYHDQALIAAKYDGLENVVNITLGLPFLRTSPGHGVAYDIVDQHIANPSSFQNAFAVIEKRAL